MPTTYNLQQKRTLRVVTVNIWQPEETNFWPQRRDVMVDELREKGFTNSSDTDIVIALQEVLLYKGSNPAYEIGEELGFSEDQVHFFPTRIGGKMGVAIITNFPITRSANRCIDRSMYKEPEPILKEARRNVGLLETERNGKPLILAVTHITYETENNQQTEQAKVCLSEICQFANESVLENNGIPARTELMNLTELSKHMGIIVCGDYNADTLTEAYRMFNETGFKDWTHSLREQYGVSWPVDIPWLKELNQNNTSNTHPLLPYDSIKRWMDYIFGIGLEPIESKLLGLSPAYVPIGQHNASKLYASDHSFPAVYLN